MNKLLAVLTQFFWKHVKIYGILLDNLIFGRYKKFKLYNFVFLNYLRKSEKSHLLKEDYLYKLISQISLHFNPNFYAEFSFLKKYFSTGILMLQYPNQFAKYLITLSKYNIKSYLEIGTGLGGSFITTVEYLMKLNPEFQYAIGIDRLHYISMQIYAQFNDRVDYIIMDTRSSAFKEFIRKCPHFDLAFIDSSKSYEECLRTFEIIKTNIKMVAFHDILQKEVDAVWNHIKDLYSNEYSLLEFTDQCLKRGQYLGIGLIIKKE